MARVCGLGRNSEVTAIGAARPTLPWKVEGRLLAAADEERRRVPVGDSTVERGLL